MNHLEIALAHHQDGHLDAAITSYRAALAENPQDPDALHMMGVIAQQRGNSALALSLIEAALAVDPLLAGAWSNRAMVLRALNRTDEALQSTLQALALDESLADAWDMAGALLRQKKRYEESRHYHEQALRLQPDNTTFQANFAALLLTLEDVAAAYHLLFANKRPDPQTPDLPLVTGHIIQASGYPADAIAYFHEALASHPELIELGTDEALANLKVANFEEGWKLWQNRADTWGHLFKTIPKWKGETVEHIILYEDQGLGDALQAIRYIPFVKTRAKRITLYLSTPVLEKLFAASFPYVTLQIGNPSLLEADARCELMSLPYFFKTDLKNIPADIPYLQAPAINACALEEALATRPLPRIGLVWAGNIDYGKNYSRSLHFSQLTSILQAAAGHIVSLQKGPQKEQADFKATDILDADPWLDDFATTASLINQLDLVITVDTAVAHLAGGLGKPVWILLPFDPDWRWMLEREDSPWYPTARLFRKAEPHNWAPLLDYVKDEVIRFIEGDSKVLKPKIWTNSPAMQNSHAMPLWD